MLRLLAVAAAQQLFHPPDDVLRLERLGEHIVAAERLDALLVDRLGRAGQKDDRNVRQPRRVLHVRGHFVAVFSRHPDVGQHDVRRLGIEVSDCLIAVADRDDLDVLVGEGQLDDALDGDAVVGKQQLMGHDGVIGSRP